MLAGTRIVVVFGLAAILQVATTSAQQSAKKAEAATGSVTGTVTCADTNAPARFATVKLERVPTLKEENAKSEEVEPGIETTATTDLDGHFALEKVPAGRYFVIGILSGYMVALARFDHEELRKPTEETLKAMIKAVPNVWVEPGQVAQANIRLEHASELSGTILYDDGSPAINLNVKLLKMNKDGSLSSVDGIMDPGSGSMMRTDDRGRYRFYGVSPGEYAVSVIMRTEKTGLGGLLGDRGFSISVWSNQGGELGIYSGNTFRKKDAATLKIGEGDQAGGLDITIPLSQLHTVRGTLTAKRDGHPLSKGHVVLLYAEDRQQAEQADIDRDGNFSFPYVPDGKYILTAGNGADVEFTRRYEFNSNFTDEKVLRRYGGIETPITVSAEMSGLELAVPDAAPKVASQ